MKQTKTNTITVKIDGKDIHAPEGSTVLQAAKNAGIYIPSLCYIDKIKNYGGCRLCVVQIENMRGFPTACTTPVTPNMKITTKSPELQKLRRGILELLLSEHPYTCLVCKDKGECQDYMHSTRKVGVTTGCNFCTNNGICELQELVDFLELEKVRFPITYRNLPPVKDNPFYELDYNLCILCGRCVRICNEERYSDVLAFVNRGNSTLVGTIFNESQKDAGCEFCGACVDVCPTGSISEKMGSWAGIPDKSTKTTCTFCSIACTMNVNTKVNRIVNVGPMPGKRTEPIQLCVRGKFVPGDITHNPLRITKPLIKKSGKWIEAEWDETINYIADNLGEFSGKRFGLIGSAQDTMENGYVLQKFSRKVMHSNNVDTFLSYSNKHLIKKIHDNYISNKAVQIDDITKADTVFVFGSQAYLSHPIIENRIRKAYKNGKQVITANTFFNKTSLFSNQSIIYKPGEENNFLLLILNHLFKKNKRKIPAKISQTIKDLDVKGSLKRCGITANEINQLVNTLIHSEDLIFIVGDGALKTNNGIFNFNALHNIQSLLKQSINCRIMFLLDDGNRYGITLAGMHPDYIGEFESVLDSSSRKKWSEKWKTKLSNTEGITGDEMIRNITKDGITALYVVGDIPAHKNLSGLKFFIHQNMFLTETSEHADVFLPLSNFMESEGHIVNIEQNLKEITRVVNPPDNIQPTWSIMSGIAKAMKDDNIKYNSIQDIFSEIKSNIDLTFSGSAATKSDYFPIKAETSNKSNGFPYYLIIEPNYFHFMGNLLTDHIRDMKKIRDEGILFLSTDIFNKMKINEGDHVMLITKYGEMRAETRVMTELASKTVYFKPSWKHNYLFTEGINQNTDIVRVKIESIHNGKNN